MWGDADDAVGDDGVDGPQTNKRRAPAAARRKWRRRHMDAYRTRGCRCFGHVKVNMARVTTDEDVKKAKKERGKQAQIWSRNTETNGQRDGSPPPACHNSSPRQPNDSPHVPQIQSPPCSLPPTTVFIPSTRQSARHSICAFRTRPRPCCRPRFDCTLGFAAPLHLRCSFSVNKNVSCYLAISRK